jgi:hypothetical protein
MSATTPRIDKLTPGTAVTLEFAPTYSLSHDGPYEAPSVFLGIVGEGDERLARFLSALPNGVTYEWEAYRSSGRWVYGSGAEKLRLVSVNYNPWEV